MSPNFSKTSFTTLFFVSNKSLIIDYALLKFKDKVLLSSI